MIQQTIIGLNKSQWLVAFCLFMIVMATGKVKAQSDCSFTVEALLQDPNSGLPVKNTLIPNLRIVVSPDSVYSPSAIWQEQIVVRTDDLGRATFKVGVSSTSDPQLVFCDVLSRYDDIYVHLYDWTYNKTFQSVKIGEVPYANYADRVGESEGFPVGAIVAYVSQDNLPEGFLQCKTNSAGLDTNRFTFFRPLARLLSNYWRNGSAAVVPDLSGYFLRGVSRYSGNDPDVNNRTPHLANMPNEVGSIQTDELREHHHWFSVNTFATVYSNNISSGLISPLFTFTYPAIVPNTGCTQGSSQCESTNLNSTNQETRPKNAAVQFLIKAY